MSYLIHVYFIRNSFIISKLAGVLRTKLGEPILKLLCLAKKFIIGID